MEPAVFLSTPTDPVVFLPTPMEHVVFASNPIEPVVAAIDLDLPANLFMLDRDEDF